MSKIDVKKISNLGNLPISPKEEKLYQTQLEKILGYVDQIEKKIKTTNEEPTFNVSKNPQRKSNEILTDSLSQPDALKNASDVKDGYFKSKRVLKHA